jgi:hypothetical protein
VEPMINNVQLVKNASKLMGLDDKEFVVIQAAISSRGGNAKFPLVEAGTENAGLQWCGQICNSSIQECCPDVNMYSLDSYVDTFVGSKGPINVLSIVLREVILTFFGASSTLDRTYYLKFEYHEYRTYSFLFDINHCLLLLTH